MGRIVWKKEWTLDCGFIDEQHKQLIDIVNLIIEGKIPLQELLKQLIHYSGAHFGDEESYMLESGYPGKDITAHKLEHRKFTNTILDISFEVIQNTDAEDVEKLTDILERFCVLWFQSHFLNTDKKFTDFLRKNNKHRR